MSNESKTTMAYTAEQLAHIKLIIDSGNASNQMILEFAYLKEAIKVQKAKCEENNENNISQEDN